MGVPSLTRVHVRTRHHACVYVCTRPHDCVYVCTRPHHCVYVQCSAPWKISDSQAADNSRSSALTSGFPYPPVGVTTDSFTTGDSSSPYFTLPTTTSDSATTTTGKHTACMPALVSAETTSVPTQLVFMLNRAHPFLGGGGEGWTHGRVNE
jgi:hypothetical protein